MLVLATYDVTDISLKDVDHTVTMSCLVKQHVRHKTRMQHPSNLDSFMDETDREVMNLTNRAFKSLCIGDEAIYNDSELLRSPVFNHKPLPEAIPKKSLENSAVDFKKHEARKINGVYNTPWQTKDKAKVSSRLAAFAGKKTSGTKMTNGDSWDKSALLSIQTELSEFSLDYQTCLMEEHIDRVKNHNKPSEKGKNKSVQDIHSSSGKSSKNQHGKSAKLRKLNYINFFLHSEYSPFQAWEDLNRFGPDNMETFLCSSPAGFYESPIYKELNNSNRLHVPELYNRESSQSTSPLEPQHKSKTNLSQCTAQNQKTIHRLEENHPELNFLPQPDLQIKTLQPQTLPTSSGSFQRCQSEGDICAPWRKSRSKSKGVVQSFICTPASEGSNTGGQGALQNKKEVTTVENGTCLNVTPFNISQLLTPVIPSRQETGTSEIMQSVQSPKAIDVPALHETEIHSSPDFKREEYKSKASSLLFNLKDNRKRVKATYSPPKFKGVDVLDQVKLSPLIEQDVTQNVTDQLEIAEPKTMSTVHKASMYPMSPETTDIQRPQISGHINSTLPDDFLGLSLLLAENKGSKKNPLTKATYPSLNMYPKSSSGKMNTKTMPTEVPLFNPSVNISGEKMSKEHLPEKNSKDSHHLIKPETNYPTHEYTHQNQVGTADKVPTEKTNVVVLKEKNQVLNTHNAPNNAGSRNQDELNPGEIFTAEETPIKYKKGHRKETQPKHLFSARQNNFIKNQRYVNVDHGNVDECEFRQEDAISGGRDELRKNALNVCAHDDNGKVQEGTDYIVMNDAFTKHNSSQALKKDLDICTEQGVTMKNDALTMKGNTSAKIAMFTLKEKPSNSVPGSAKKNIVKDKYELATMALEKRIAEREQRKKQSDRKLGQDLARKGEGNQESMLTSGQKDRIENVIAGNQEQKSISDFRATSQMVQSMPYIDTDQSDGLMNEIKLDGPCKQGTAKHSPNRPIYTGRNRPDRHGQKGATSSNQAMVNVTELKETMRLPQNICLDQESLDVSEDTARNEKQRKDDVSRESSLMEKVNRENAVTSLTIRDCVNQEDNHMVYLGNDSLNENSISTNNMSFSEGEDILTNQQKTQKARDSDKELPKKGSKSNVGKEENLENVNGCVTRNGEDKKDVTRTENENASQHLRKTDNQTSFKCHDKSFAKENFTDHLEKSDEPGHNSNVSTLNFLNPNNVPIDRLTLSEILNQVEPPYLPEGTQLEEAILPSEQSGDCSLSHKTDGTPAKNKIQEKKHETLDTNDFYSNFTPESKLHNSDSAVHPPKDVEKIESPTCHSNVSSPTLGKPALFKVKDNKFRASPVTKTVRPILHKSVAGVTQPWSPRESLSGSEKAEEDPNLFKDPKAVQSPPSPITQPNQSSIQAVHSPSSQSITDLGRTELIDSSTVTEVEDWQLAICSVSDGLASCDMSTRETVEELAFNTAPPDSTQESKAPSERSDSACSGIENQLQGKPPAVPPKTDKAMRRAMKLTTKRIQKAEAKSKSDRGRSGEKGSCHKRERRHHSSDKVLSDSLYQREHSIDTGSNNQSTDEDSRKKSLPGSHTSERQAIQHKQPNRCWNEKDSGSKQHSCHSSLISMDGDAKNSVSEKQNKTQSLHKDQFDSQKINVDSERLGRTSKKYLPQKLYRRAHSLDRFSSSKHEHSILSSNVPASKTNTETLKMLSTAETAPLRQNSIEHTYSSVANNMVPQTFPMTQRKLLQDLDSGQYFVVDMPVQVKTKTFFDPETGSYVQLPVQSLEGSIPRAQSVEVVNATPLMLYHGFVSLPVSSLP